MRLKNIVSHIIGSLFLFGLVACSQYNPFDEIYGDREGIRFRAYLQSANEIDTRATDEDERYMIGSDLYPCYFYVQGRAEVSPGDVQTRGGTYMIPSGYEGSLTAIVDKENPDDKPLNWFSRTSPHEFWSWTLPNDPEFRPDENTSPDYTKGIPIKFRDTDLSGTVNLKNSTATSKLDIEWREDSWANGRCLEQMLGGYNAYYTYENDGIYVPLHYKHLISKIFLGKLTIVNNFGGSSSSTIRAVITFFGMPTEVTLYPCPTDAEGKGIAPYIKADNWNYDLRSELKFAITNMQTTYKWEGHSVTAQDCWYIPPEMDFSKLEFKIEVQQWNTTLEQWEPNPNYGIHGAYYGDFKNVKFDRTGADRYNNPEGGDETILHAGEYLNLSVTLYQKGNPGVGGEVVAMAPPNERDAQAHDQPGIYSVDQMKDMCSAMASGEPDQIEDFYKMNGSGLTTADDPAGEYPNYRDIYGRELDIINIFDDIGSNASGNNVSSKVGPDFAVADGYILDGMGHTVNVNTSTASGKTNTLTIGPMRDIYLRYYSGTTQYILYIDKMGNVWKINPNNYEATETPYNVLNGNNPVTINMSTGVIS